MAGKWWTLVAVCTGVFMLLLDITIVNVALPDIQRDLDASLSDLQWVIDAYALTLAALLLTAGSLADRYGRKRLFAIGTLVFTLGSLFCGLAPTVLFLSLARAAQGVGGAIMFATALALLSGAFSGRERGTAFAYFGATTGVAVAVGPVLGGVLTSGLSWHWIFWVNIPICVLALAVTLTKVEESSDPHAGRPDWIGFVTFSSGLGLLVLALIRGGVDGWGDSLVVSSFVASGVLLVAFVVSQIAAGEADVRPRAAPQAHLRRRPGRRARGVGVGLLAADLPDHLRAERARLLRRRGRRAVPVPVRHVVRRRDHRGPADQPRAHQVADRPRLPGRGARAVPDARHHRRPPSGPT